MNAKLERIEIEGTVLGHDDLAVEHATRRQLLQYRIDQLGKITIERFFVTALDHYLVAVAKNKCAEAAPLWFKNPITSAWEITDTFGEHRQDRRVYGKLHDCVTCFLATDYTDSRREATGEQT